MDINLKNRFNFLQKIILKEMSKRVKICTFIIIVFPKLFNRDSRC